MAQKKDRLKVTTGKVTKLVSSENTKKQAPMIYDMGRNVGSQKHKTRKASSYAGLWVCPGGEGGIPT